MKKFFLIIFTLALLSSCKTSQVKEINTPEGQWQAEVAPEFTSHLMTLAKVPTGLSIDWKATFDEDMIISGVLTDQGADVFSGIVDFSVGDEPNLKEPTTLHFDRVHQTISLELESMGPITFNRAKSSTLAKKSCSELAEDIVAASGEFSNLMKENTKVQLIETGNINKIHDFRVFTDLPDSETHTLKFFRVDFNKKELLEYNPVDDEFTVLKGADGLFEKVDCSPH